MKTRVRVLTKKPLQVYLQPYQVRALRELAAREHASLAGLIRRSIDRYLAEAIPPEQDPSLGLIGLGRGERPDLSLRHDELVTSQATPQPGACHPMGGFAS